MIPGSLFRGDRVRLTAEEPETWARAFVRWNRDSYYQRLLDTEPAMVWSVKSTMKWCEAELLAEPPKFYLFGIRLVEDDRLVGCIGIEDIRWSPGEGWVGPVAIGERPDWGKGYGSQALRLLLRYAFDELGLHRLSLDVYGYNNRAHRIYEKEGFRLEGRERGAIIRDGRRSDILVMGLLREEWLAQQVQSY